MLFQNCLLIQQKDVLSIRVYHSMKNHQVRITCAENTMHKKIVVQQICNKCHKLHVTQHFIIYPKKSQILSCFGFESDLFINFFGSEVVLSVPSCTGYHC